MKLPIDPRVKLLSNGSTMYIKLTWTKALTQYIKVLIQEENEEKSIPTPTM